MRRAALTFAAAAAVAAARCAVPGTSEEWYTPAGGFKTDWMTGTIYYGWDREHNSWQTVEVCVDETGDYEIDGGSLATRDYALKTAIDALVDALAAQTQAARNKESIETIAQNLHSLLTVNGIDMETVDPNGNVHTYTLKMKNGGTLGSQLGGGSNPTLVNPAGAYNHADERSLHWTKGNKVEIYAWSDADYVQGFGEFPLGTLLYNGTETKAGSITLLGRMPDGVPLYIPIDKVRWPVPDEESVTTNAASGAANGGSPWTSLHGWTDAADGEVPFKSVAGEKSTLAWVSPEKWADGVSVAWDADANDGAGAFGVKGAAENGGENSRRYFGTGGAPAAALGWHELPKTVHGDGATVSTDASVPVEGVADPATAGAKGVGLRGWDYSYGGDAPLFLANVGGSLSYLPVDGGTNAPSCACSNRWEDALAWLGDGEDDGAGGLSFSEDSLSAWLKSLGFVHASPAGDGAEYGFDLDAAGGVSAPFDAPANWADGASVEVSDGGAFALKGFSSAAACSASVSAMLKDPSGADAATHLLLAKKTDTGALHYVPIGGGVSGGGLPADGASVTTNAADGAASQGVLSLRGWSGAAEGTMAVRAGGTLAWVPTNSVPPADGASVAMTEDGAFSVKGFADAGNDTIPRKDAEGNLVWGGFSAATNVILAGAGINVTDNGGGAVTISAQPLESSSSEASQSVEVVTDVRYDAASHKFQKKTRTLTFRGTMADESEWEDVFTATSHKAEHGQED